MERRNNCFAVFLLCLALIASSCSGDDGPDLDPAGSAPIDQIDAGSAGVVESGPLNGLLSVQPSFGFGLYVIDPETGSAAAVPGIAAVESIDRNHDVILSGDSAYSLGSRVREGQTFASDISLVRVSFENGEVAQLAALGFDRETDDSSESVLHELVAATEDNLVVRQSTFGQSETVYRVFNTKTGTEETSFTEPRYEFSSDSGSCSGNVHHLVGLSDGRLAGVAVGSPAIVNPDNGEVEVLVSCDQEDAELRQFATEANVSDYAVFNESATSSSGVIDLLLDTELEPENGFVEGDGDLWWVVAQTRTINDVQVIVGGIVQFDLDSQTVEAVFPVGASLGAYTDCGPDAEVCELQTLAQAQLRFLDGHLVVMDPSENGQLLVLNPTSRALTVVPLERGTGVDYTSATLLAGDPANVWLSVRRMTVTSEDGGQRTAVGETYIELLNSVSGTIDLSLAAEDIFF